MPTIHRVRLIKTPAGRVWCPRIPLIVPAFSVSSFNVNTVENRSTVSFDSYILEVNSDAMVMNVEEHPFVQRLSRVKQLGTMGYIFPIRGNPNISYTRLEHSRGTARLGHRLAKRLMHLTCTLPISDPRRVTTYHAFVLQLACLLHDLGHGPLSHQFDAYVEEQNLQLRADGMCGSRGALPDHEDRGVLLARFVLDDCWCQSSAWQVAFPGGIEDLHGHIRSLILGEPSLTLPVCLIRTVHAASTLELDLDRLDYLPRDADVLVTPRSGLRPDWMRMAHLAIDMARLTDNMSFLEFEPRVARDMLTLRRQLCDNYYVHTARHRNIVRVAMSRMASPRMMQLLYLRTREDAMEYMRTFDENRLVVLCVEEGLTVAAI